MCVCFKSVINSSKYYMAVIVYIDFKKNFFFLFRSNVDVNINFFPLAFFSFFLSLDSSSSNIPFHFVWVLVFCLLSCCSCVCVSVCVCLRFFSIYRVYQTKTMTMAGWLMMMKLFTTHKQMKLIKLDDNDDDDDDLWLTKVGQKKMT